MDEDVGADCCYSRLQRDCCLSKCNALHELDVQAAR